jgi:prepilin-type N-terminal cleavage/methylation domain-containing protein
MRNNDDGRSRLSSAMRRPTGFTLVELIVVMVIISIILVFMLNASMNSLRSAQEKATQGLIAKLDSALSDRVDAILQTRVTSPTLVQSDIAQIYDGITSLGNASNSERAFVLAQIELFLREMPDVFYIQDPTTFNYPLNFAANPYPINYGAPYPLATAVDTDARYVLPLGMGWPYNAAAKANYFNAGLGIYGASYQVAAGLYKNLGYWPTGFDGVDNNSNGRVDEWAEGVGVVNGVDNTATVQTNLAAHTHKTARAEMLYALLVEAQGPFGAILNRDDFTDKEVQDTDGDGLPEFVDAWGEPLQFYRWPLLFHSELQHGQRFLTNSTTGNPILAAPYDDMILQRELDPLDPNQQLMSPAWWSSGFNDATKNSAVPPFPAGFMAGKGNWSPGVAFFENYFHLLHEPLFNSSQAPVLGQFWDRGAPGGDFAARRAFSSKFLVVSSGPDKQLGVFQYDDAGLKSDLATAASGSMFRSAYPLVGIESLAAPLAYDDLTTLVSPSGGASLLGALGANSLQIQSQGQDDINNHNVPAGGIGGSAP